MAAAKEDEKTLCLDGGRRGSRKARRDENGEEFSGLAGVTEHPKFLLARGHGSMLTRLRDLYRL